MRMCGTSERRSKLLSARRVFKATHARRQKSRWRGLPCYFIWIFVLFPLFDTERVELPIFSLSRSRPLGELCWKNCHRFSFFTSSGSLTTRVEASKSTPKTSVLKRNWRSAKVTDFVWKIYIWKRSRLLGHVCVVTVVVEPPPPLPQGQSLGVHRSSHPSTKWHTTPLPWDVGWSHRRVTWPALTKAYLLSDAVASRKRRWWWR